MKGSTRFRPIFEHPRREWEFSSLVTSFMQHLGVRTSLRGSPWWGPVSRDLMNNRGFGRGIYHLAGLGPEYKRDKLYQRVSIEDESACHRGNNLKHSVLCWPQHKREIKPEAL